MSEAPKKRWYVVQAFSGFEGRALKGHHLMPFLHAFVPEPGSSVIFFVIIIAETGSVEGV